MWSAMFLHLTRFRVLSSALHTTCFILNTYNLTTLTQELGEIYFGSEEQGLNTAPMTINPKTDLWDI